MCSEFRVPFNIGHSGRHFGDAGKLVNEPRSEMNCGQHFSKRFSAFLKERIQNRFIKLLFCTPNTERGIYHFQTEILQRPHIAVSIFYTSNDIGGRFPRVPWKIGSVFDFFQKIKIGTVNSQLCIGVHKVGEIVKWDIYNFKEIRNLSHCLRKLSQPRGFIQRKGIDHISTFVVAGRKFLKYFLAIHRLYDSFNFFHCFSIIQLENELLCVFAPCFCEFSG